MFETAEDWEKTGFKILRSSDNKICVASHKTADGYLFKKYVSSGKRDSLKDQIDNYSTRVDGARRLRSLIDEQGLRHVVVPRKWIRELPRDFGSGKRPAHVLVVERLDLLDTRATERAYNKIDEAVLRDLCVALYAFRGLDSTAKNVPFTRDGKIAFIDTEHWNRHGDKKYKRRFLKYLGEHLTSDRLRLAGKLWDKLEGGDRLAGYDDFDDEEDTSSSSSSSSSSSW